MRNLIDKNVENRGGGGIKPFTSFRRQQRRMALAVKKLTDGTSKLTVDTDKLRALSLFSLEVLFESAVELAVDVSCRDWKQKEAWTRTATYIAQTINSVSQASEVRQIDEDLEHLQELLVKYESLVKTLERKDAAQEEQ